MILIFLLLRLQWNRINTEAGEVKETSKGNSSITKNHQSPVQLNSQRLVVHMTTTVSPSTTSHAPPAVANIKENVVKRTEIISGAKSRSLRPSDGTTFSSNVSKNWNNSATNIHRMSCAKLEQQVTFFWSDQKCYSYISFHNGTESFHSHPYHPWGFSAPSDNSSVKPTTLFPISVIRTSPMVKQDSPTPNFNPIQQTTKLNHNSSNPPTASPKDANEGKDLTKIQVV